MTSRQPEIAADVAALFAERGAELVDIPVLQPADPFLDMAGEDLRRRIFLTESETGEQLCLRPEFTIPVCLDHIAARAGTPKRYAYLGEVFRQRREGSNEFFQAGIEDLGTADRAMADARSLADASALVARALPGSPLTVTLGDQRVFEAVLAALGLPRGWQKRLARAFGSRELVAQALADLAHPAPGAPIDEALADLAAHGDEAALAAEIAGRMADANLSEHAGRGSAEIARRLIEKTELRSVRLSSEAMTALEGFLDIRVPLKEAGNRLRAFAGEAGISLGAALEAFSARARAISQHGLDEMAIVYDAGFGRPLDYYTGLVFEIALVGADRPLVGGGRYDRLLTLLGVAEPIPGVGFSVWLDRIEQARGAG
jgi:ATP phosphoribosyltransferase regulatory subunit